MKRLLEIQKTLKCNKGNFNKFGGYYYRSCEDILTAVKPLLAEHGLVLMMEDSIEEIGGRFYVEATARLFDVEDGKQITLSRAYAREEDTKKGMDGSQITGASSSYARKYALNGMFLIDDGVDSDKTNDEGAKAGELPQVKAWHKKEKAKIEADLPRFNKEDFGILTEEVLKKYSTSEDLIKAINLKYKISKENRLKIADLRANVN